MDRTRATGRAPTGQGQPAAGCVAQQEPPRSSAESSLGERAVVRGDMCR